MLKIYLVVTRAAQKLSVAASSKSRDEKARAYTAANHDKANCASVLKEWEKSMLKTNKIPHNEASITALVMVRITSILMIQRRAEYSKRYLEPDFSKD